jgi:hypothetical protein
MSLSEDDWLDEQLLADDPTLIRNWRARSRGGISKIDALAAIPDRGQIQFSMPIKEYRALREWMQLKGISPYVYIHEAVRMRLAQEPDLPQWILGCFRDD